MSGFKSEINHFLLKNKFLINDNLSDKSTSVYDYIFSSEYIYRIELNLEPNDKSIICHFETILDKKRYTEINRFVLNSFKEFYFLITQQMRSPLFEANLVIS